MKSSWSFLFSCLVIFHSPDGAQLIVDTFHIGSLRPAHSIKEHVAHGTNTLLFVDGKNVGITEDIGVAERLIKDCVDGEKR